MEEPITTAPPPKPFFLARSLCWNPWPTLTKYSRIFCLFLECLIGTKLSFGSSTSDLEWPKPFNSVLQMECWHLHGRAAAIQFDRLASHAGVLGGGDVVEADVEERVKGDHVSGHIVGPFTDLWSDVDQEGVRGPTAEDHDLRR
jgi:hypothetical protein